MALIFVEGFDHQNGTGMLAKGWTRSATPGGTGRFGGTSWNTTDRSNSKSLGANYTTVICGFAYRYRAVNDAQQIVSFQDLGSAQVELRYLVSSSTFQITRNGTVLGSYVKALNNGAWYYLEWKTLIDPSVGTSELKIDGTSVISLTGQNTRNTANSYVNELKIGSTGGSDQSGDIDDLYVCDTSGGAPTNTYLGDTRVQTIFPNGNGNSSQLVGSDGNSTDNYLLVDENPANDDSDYVESSTVSDKDTYAYGDLTPTSGTVYGIQINAYARKTDAGTRKIATVARLSATEVDSADLTLSSTYTYLSDIRETKPGGGAWSITNINDAEFGVKVTA